MTQTLDMDALNEGIKALAEAQGVLLTDSALDDAAHELAATLANPSNRYEDIDDIGAIGYAIFAINTLMHPEASPHEVVADLERNSDRIIERLSKLRHFIEGT